MGTYHWDGHIGSFRGTYNVRCQVLFCGVCIHLRGRPKWKKENIKTEMWLELLKITCSWERHITMWESFWDSSWPGLPKSKSSRSARCVTCNERRMMNGHFSKNSSDGHMSLRRYGDLQTSLGTDNDWDDILKMVRIGTRTKKQWERANLKLETQFCWCKKNCPQNTWYLKNKQKPSGE